MVGFYHPLFKFTMIQDSVLSDTSVIRAKAKEKIVPKEQELNLVNK